jgi:hypothetical protein
MSRCESRRDDEETCYVSVARPAIYSVGVGLGLTEGVGEGEGSGEADGVAAKIISAGVAPGSTFSIRIRVLAAVPVCALAVVLTIVFAAEAVLVRVCVAPLKLLFNPPFPAAARVISVPWIRGWTLALVAVCATTFTFAPILMTLSAFAPLCAPLVELPLEPVYLGAAMVGVVV